MWRGLGYKSRDVLLRLYKALVRPPFGSNCEQFWAPPPVSKEGCAGPFGERVPEGGSHRMIPGMKSLSYEERVEDSGSTFVGEMFKGQEVYTTDPWNEELVV